MLLRGVGRVVGEEHGLAFEEVGDQDEGLGREGCEEVGAEEGGWGEPEDVVDGEDGEFGVGTTYGVFLWGLGGGEDEGGGGDEQVLRPPISEKTPLGS